MNPLSLFVNILCAAFIFWLGWKMRGWARGLHDRLPRWLRRVLKKEDDSPVDGEPAPAKKPLTDSILETIGKPAEKLIDKVMEKTMGGKPKGPKKEEK